MSEASYQRDNQDRRRQNARISKIVITQKAECASYQHHNQIKRQNARVYNVPTSQKTECASYQPNNFTENRMHQLPM